MGDCCSSTVSALGVIHLAQWARRYFNSSKSELHLRKGFIPGFLVFKFWNHRFRFCARKVISTHKTAFLRNELGCFPLQGKPPPFSIKEYRRRYSASGASELIPIFTALLPNLLASPSLPSSLLYQSSLFLFSSFLSPLPLARSSSVVTHRRNRNCPTKIFDPNSLKTYLFFVVFVCDHV